MAGGAVDDGGVGCVFAVIWMNIDVSDRLANFVWIELWDRDLRISTVQTVTNVNSAIYAPFCRGKRNG